MVQRNNNDSVNYLTSIIQWIHNNPPPVEQCTAHDNKTNPRQQLLSPRHLKRNRHRIWRSLPEFGQENIITDTKLS